MTYEAQMITDARVGSQIHSDTTKVQGFPPPLAHRT